MNAREAWSATLGQLQVQLNRATFDTWLGRAEYVGYEDGRLVMSTADCLGSKSDDASQFYLLFDGDGGLMAIGARTESEAD